MQKSTVVVAAIAATIVTAIGMKLLSSKTDDSPYSLSLAKINENGPQRSAVILLSDPQIYTRERLLNDRDLEYAYLKKQLDDIDTKDFTPRLRRDLDQLVEVVGALSANVNPLKGAEAVQGAQIAALTSDIQIEQLRKQLEALQAETAAVENKPAETPQPGANGDATKPAKTESGGQEAAASKDSIVELQAVLTALEARIDKRNPDGSPRTSRVTSATPAEELHDKLAYRNELQSAMEQAQLDDRHDLNGNALYRLQFQATILPGTVKDKYGVARMSILPPAFDDDKPGVWKLYLDWLAYVASQLNPLSVGSGAKRGPEQTIVDRYRMFGAATNIYHTVSLPYAPGAYFTSGEIEDEEEAKLQEALFSDMSLNASYVPGLQNERCREAFAGKEFQPVLSGNVQENPEATFYFPIPPALSAAPLLVAMIPPCREQLELFLAQATLYIANHYEVGDSSSEYLRWDRPEPGKCVRLTYHKADGADDKLFNTDDSHYWNIAPLLRDVLPRYATLEDAHAALEKYAQAKTGDSDDEDRRKELLALAKRATDSKTPPGTLSREDLGLALVVARNLHNLAPAYILAIERTASALQRRGSASDSEVTKLRGYALSVSQAAAAARKFLEELEYAVDRPIQAKVKKIGTDTSSAPQSTKDLYQVLDAAKSLDDALEPVDDADAAEADDFEHRRVWNAIEERQPCLTLDSIASLVATPVQFYDTVTADRWNNFPYDKHKPFAGATYAYSTAPTELAQRVSTVTSATQALDLMAAIGATMPQAGTSLDASGALRRIASGQVDAIESAPLVVGFSNSGPANTAADQYGARDNVPSFGWVFGPKVIVDAKNRRLNLSQVLVTQPVTADISVPGWWKTLRLHVETAWVANFDKAALAERVETDKRDGKAQPKSRVTDYIIEVPLHVNPSSYEQLTEYIANKTWGLQYKLPVITNVSPATVFPCANATLLISGADLWRGRQVFLNGKPASLVQIMPDMQGLAATFDLSKAQLGKASLVVWTQLGQVVWPQPGQAQSDAVTITDSRDCAAPKPAASSAGGGK